jgi:hypothetical protein
MRWSQGLPGPPPWSCPIRSAHGYACRCSGPRLVALDPWSIKTARPAPSPEQPIGTCAATVDDLALGKGYVNWVRHMALRWRFILDHDEWLIDITPDYRFTVDGYRPSSMAAELASKIKRMERHAAVRGQMEFGRTTCDRHQPTSSKQPRAS